MLLTAFGAFLGALLSLLVGIVIEYQRKPKLSIEIEQPPVDQSYANAPAKTARFLRVVVANRAMPRLLRWLGRSTAQQCSGHISFHHLDDGAPILSKPMPIRWAASEEPVSFQIVENQVVSMFDPAKYNAAFRRDCFPGIPEPADVVARFDNEDDCYGWSNENYLPHKGWRNPEFKLPKGRYLVAVVIRSSGEDVSKILKLENSVGAQHFRLMEASAADAAKVGQHA
jgi:hypothetical protein